MALIKIYQGSEVSSNERLMHLALSLWNVSKSICGLLAISQRNLRIVNVPFGMSCIGVIPDFMRVMIKLIPLVSPEVFADYWRIFPEYIVNQFLTLISLVLIPVGLKITGAWKVRKILVEMNFVQERVKEERLKLIWDISEILGLSCCLFYDWKKCEDSLKKVPWWIWSQKEFVLIFRKDGGNHK